MSYLQTLDAALVFYAVLQCAVVTWSITGHYHYKFEKDELDYKKASPFIMLASLPLMGLIIGVSGYPIWWHILVIAIGSIFWGNYIIYDLKKLLTWEHCVIYNLDEYVNASI